MQAVFRLLGGLGLFLVGMSLLTDGLTHFAGDSLRRGLLRFTGSPFKAFASGTLLTLVVQSSTATTITLIGFVSAGLITFAQSLGVVMGASLGTTGTGWIVSTLGLKVPLGFYTLPMIGIGALLRLLVKGRWRRGIAHIQSVDQHTPRHPFNDQLRELFTAVVAGLVSPYTTQRFIAQCKCRAHNELPNWGS